MMTDDSCKLDIRNNIVYEFIEHLKQLKYVKKFLFGNVLSMMSVRCSFSKLYYNKFNSLKNNIYLFIFIIIQSLL